MIERMNQYVEARTRDAQADPRPTHEFITTALTESDEKVAWDAVVTLHFRGTRDVFDAACQLCASECPQERTLGANILGQLGVPVHSFPQQSARVLSRLLSVERDEEVLDAICIALGHIHEPIAVPSLVRLKTHPSARVRYAVVFGLLGFENPSALKTLIKLSTDQDKLVRDWATFDLGTQVETDTPEIRAALFARVFDEDEVTRGEALVGLARRKDRRIIEPLIKELERYPDAEYPGYSLEAAEAIAEPCLLPVLTHLKQSADPSNTTFDDAIRRCLQSAASAAGDSSCG